MPTLDRWIAALEDVAVERHPDRLELTFPEGRLLVRWDEGPAYTRVGRFGVSHRGDITPALDQRIREVSEALRQLAPSSAPPASAQSPSEQSPSEQSPSEQSPSEQSPSAPSSDLPSRLLAVREPELRASLEAVAGLPAGSFHRLSGRLGQASARGNKLVFRAATRVACVFPTARWAPRLARRQRALEAVGALVPPLYAHGELPGPMGYLIYGRVREGLVDAAARRVGSVRFAGALGESLARFHRASEAAAAPPDESAQLALELSRWPDLERRALAVRLHRHFAAAPPPRVALVHTDVHPANALFDGRRAWLVDLDAARVGDPMLDLACARATCTGGGAAWRALRERYERASGHRVDEREVDAQIALRALVACRDEPSATSRWRWSRALSAARARLGWDAP